MIIERTDKELIIRIPNKDKTNVQNIMDYINFMEISRKSKATKRDLNNFVNEVKKDRWIKTKDKINW